MTAARYSRIIAAVDGSEQAGCAAAAAATLAQQMNCPLILLYVFVAPGPDEFISLDNVSGALLDPARLSPEAMAAAKQEAGQKAFAAARRAIGNNDVEIEEHVVTGRVVPEILRFVETGESAILVIGRRGLGRVGEFLLGSVSDKLVRQSKAPVMVL
jgi:nucleotide-binding universal stress UspA family protein